VFADFREQSAIPALEACIKNYFDIVKTEDIRKNVLQSLCLSSHMREKLVEDNAPRFMKSQMKDFVGVENTAVFNEL
jgi:hypothetical protein